MSKKLFPRLQKVLQKLSGTPTTPSDEEEFEMKMIAAAEVAEEGEQSAFVADTCPPECEEEPMDITSVSIVPDSAPSPSTPSNNQDITSR